MVTFTEVLNKPEDKEKYKTLLDKGSISYQKKLWNGKYYNFDCSKRECESIMADQLCGHWYLSCCGYGDEVRNSLLPAFGHCFNYDLFQDISERKRTKCS